jgi:RNA polymerase sigma-70 factor (ECF subfamily)
MNSQDRTKSLTLNWTAAQPTVAAYISSMVTAFQDAEDILQTVALTIAEKYGSYDSSCSFLSWALGIARNKIYEYYRTQSKLRKMNVLNIETVDQVAQIFEKENPRLNEMHHAMEYCLGKLSGHWRQIVEMRYVRELSTQRMAQQLGMSKNAIFLTLHRVRLALQTCVQKQLSMEQERR